MCWMGWMLRTFVIDGRGQIGVASNTTLDYEIKISYTVTVSVSDGKDAHGNTDLSMDDAKGVTISVVDIEEDRQRVALTVTAAGGRGDDR